MHIKMGKLKTILFVITCWLTAFTVMFQLPEGVVVSDIYQAFPNDAAIVTAMLSLPSLMTAVASLIGGALLKKVTTKLLLILSGICCIVMLAAPIPNSALVLFLCTMVAAFGAGFANTAGMAILCEVFVDPALRGRQMGYYNAVMAALGALGSYVAGLLAVNGWKAFSHVYWITIPMLIMTILFLPNIRPENRPAEPEEAETGAEVGRKGFGKEFWMFFITMFLFFMVYVPVSTYISVYISENEIGSTSLSGICTAIGTLGSCICNIFFGTIYGKLKKWLGCVVFLIDAAVIFLAMTAPSAPVAITVCIVCGVSYGAMFSYCYAYAAEAVPLSQNGMAMGIMTFCYSIGMAVGVYLVDFSMVWFGGSLTRALVIQIALCGIAIVLECVRNLSFGRKKRQSREMPV